MKSFPVPVLSNTDKDDGPKNLGISTINFKHAAGEGENRILIIENIFKQKGGPAKHVHYYQDEWFYAIHGSFIIEIDDKRYSIGEGDSLLAPKGIAHVWAFTGTVDFGKMLILFHPAGKMESFFRKVSELYGTMPPSDPILWKEHDMEIVGPPLKI